MLSTITTLLPFGYERGKKNTCVMYLVNVGVTQHGDYNYLVYFCEKTSSFTNFERVEKIKLINNWDRNRSNFELMREIYGQITTSMWFDLVEEPDVIEYLKSKNYNGINWTKAIEQFRLLAEKDGVYDI